MRGKAAGKARAGGGWAEKGQRTYIAQLQYMRFAQEVREGGGGREGRRGAGLAERIYSTSGYIYIYTGLAERVDGVVGEGGQEALPALEVEGRHGLVELPDLPRGPAGRVWAAAGRPAGSGRRSGTAGGGGGGPAGGARRGSGRRLDVTMPCGMAIT
jgi:hypothetical protein